MSKKINGNVCLMQWFFYSEQNIHIKDDDKYIVKMLRIQLRKMEILYRITNQWVMSWFRFLQECCFIIDGSLCVPLFSLIVSWNNQWQGFHILHRVAWLWMIINLLFSFLNLHSNVACNFVYESTSICVGVEMRGTGVS